MIDLFSPHKTENIRLHVCVNKNRAEIYDQTGQRITTNYRGISICVLSICKKAGVNTAVFEGTIDKVGRSNRFYAFDMLLEDNSDLSKKSYPHRRWRLSLLNDGKYFKKDITHAPKPLVDKSSHVNRLITVEKNDVKAIEKYPYPNPRKNDYLPELRDKVIIAHHHVLHHWANHNFEDKHRGWSRENIKIHHDKIALDLEKRGFNHGTPLTLEGRKKHISPRELTREELTDRHTYLHELWSEGVHDGGDITKEHMALCQEMETRQMSIPMFSDALDRTIARIMALKDDDIMSEETENEQPAPEPVAPARSSEESLSNLKAELIKKGFTEDEATSRAPQILQRIESMQASNLRKSPPKGYPKSRSQYADPTRWKYPIDTEEHVRAALSYFSKPANRTGYSGDEVKKIAGRILSAALKRGITVNPNFYKLAGRSPPAK